MFKLSSLNPFSHPGRDAYTGIDFNYGFSVSHYNLELTYRVEPNLLQGQATLTLTTVDEPLRQLTLDLANNMVARRVTCSGAPRVTKFRQSNNKLRLNFADDIPPETEFTLVIRYGGNPQPLRTPWGDIGWEETESGALVASQPNGAPSWFPCDDTPSEKAWYDITITADNPFTVVSNGALKSRKSQGATTRWHYRPTAPMATYLATVQVGEFTQSALGDNTRAWYPAELSAPVREEFARQQEMLEFLESCFGEYPFPHYGVVVTADELEIPLEAQGLSIFGSNHVKGDHAFERLIVHELSHQWFGNACGINDWQNIWLNEGFACYSEWLWLEHSTGTPAHETARSHYNVLRHKAQDIEVGNPGPRDMFDDRVYKRGALTVHSLRRLLGDAAFFPAIQAYLAQGRHGTVTPAGLTKHLHTTADQVGVPHESVDKLLEAWLDAKELPKFPA